MSDISSSEQAETAIVDRRALLRTGGAAVVAGVAGLTVAQTVAATSAQAASGAGLVMEIVNDSVPTRRH